MATMVYDYAMAMLVDSYRAAISEAYDNRHSMRWVALDSAAHAVLAEAYQRLREEAWRESAAQFRREVGDPALQRDADGTAPPLRTIYGLLVRIDDTAEGIEWDTGEPLDPMILNMFTDLNSWKAPD